MGARPSDWAAEAADSDDNEAVEAPTAVEAAAPARYESPPLCQVQFTTTAEHAELLERVRALPSHRSPRLSLGDLHLQAMRLLVETLEKQRYGTKLVVATTPESVASEGVHEETGDERLLSAADDTKPTADSTREAARDDEETAVAAASCLAPRWRGRHIPASVRRAVFERDEHRCTYVDERGMRCLETHFVEFHHRVPFARGGAHRLENLTLHCHAHNALMAEQDFGREHIEQRREGRRHAPF